MNLKAFRTSSLGSLCIFILVNWPFIKLETILYYPFMSFISFEVFVNCFKYNSTGGFIIDSVSESNSSYSSFCYISLIS